MKRARLLATVLIVALSMAAGSEAYAQRLQEGVAGQTARGTLTVREDPPERRGTGRKAPFWRHYILELTTPACMSSGGGTTPPSPTVEIYSLDDAIRASIRSLVGKMVTVKGTPRIPSRKVHGAPIIMIVAEIGESKT